jgi:hypothetical protein
MLAVDHLVRLGHRAITHLSGTSAPGAREREAGYLAAMRTTPEGAAGHVTLPTSRRPTHSHEHAEPETVPKPGRLAIRWESLPSVDPHDPRFRRLRYVRYCD